jgi:GAF domain-containing protein
MDSEEKQGLWTKLLKDFGSKSANKRPEEIYKLAIDLMASLPHFNWTGIYWLKHGVLELFEYYIGKKTDHTRIPIGKGVCGTAVAENRDIIVDDVLELDNYLACSLETRAEIVVLIKDREGTILGQIDIDSDQIAAFDEIDRKNMEILASQLAVVHLTQVIATN